MQNFGDINEMGSFRRKHDLKKEKKKELPKFKMLYTKRCMAKCSVPKMNGYGL